MGSAHLFPLSPCETCKVRLVGDWIGVEEEEPWMKCSFCWLKGQHGALNTTCKVFLTSGLDIARGKIEWWTKREADREVQLRILSLVLEGKPYGERNSLSNLVHRPPWPFAGIVDDHHTVIDVILSYTWLPQCPCRPGTMA